MKFKVGNRVEHEFYGKGTVIGVSGIGTPLVEFDKYWVGFHDGNGDEKNGTRGKYGHCWYTSGIKSLNIQTIVIYPKGLETIALLKEGKKVIKRANAKCNPTDEFDFNVGAKLAFSRLMGEEKTEDKTFDWECFKQGKFAVHCDTEEKAKAFLKECDEQGIKWSSGQKASSMTEYSSYGCETAYCCYFKDGLQFSAVNWYKASGITEIFKYQPSIREVKRPAKVGEWIKIVDADAWFDEYENGDVFKVDELYTSREEGIISSPHHIVPREYVVLENYQPEAKPFFSQSTIDEISRYTDKELINELSRRWEDKQ